MKIFIVDDDPMLTTALSDYLTRKSPHQVSTFHTGEECLSMMPTEKPDVVILDYYLNSVQRDAQDGMEILKSIKKSYPRTHIIMLSGQEHYGVAMQTIQKGAEQYVMKDENAFAKVAEMIEDY